MHRTSRRAHPIQEGITLPVSRDMGSIPALGKSPGGGWPPHSSIPAWKFHETGGLLGCSSWDHKGVGTDLVAKELYQ